jgi:hypothetical protein
VSACLPVFDLLNRFLRAFSNEPMRKLAKSCRYQGLLLLCLPHLKGWEHNHFYFPIMAIVVILVFPLTAECLVNLTFSQRVNTVLQHQGRIFLALLRPWQLWKLSFERFHQIAIPTVARINIKAKASKEFWMSHGIPRIARIEASNREIGVD